MKHTEHNRKKQTKTLSNTQKKGKRESFRENTRAGAATQIDFANAMVILLFGILFFFGASTVMLATVGGQDAGDQTTTWKAADKLVNDAFVENPNDRVVSAQCVERYFEGPLDEVDCSQNPDWGDPNGDEQAFLRNSLSLTDMQSATVEFRNADGSLYSNNSVEYRIGGDPPTDDVGEYNRRVVMDVSEEGEPEQLEWFTVTVYVW